jgi:hypothetical protein
MRVLFLLLVLNLLLVPIGNAAMMSFNIDTFVDLSAKSTVIDTSVDDDKKILHCAEMMDSDDCQMECICAISSVVIIQSSSLNIVFPFFIRLELPHMVLSHFSSHIVSPDLRPPLT